ncbi:hypothetical protein ACFL1R_02405 [Candidatus Latescibacterota bacterium]
MQYRCKVNHYHVFLFTLIILLLNGESGAVEYDFRGQLSGWTNESRNNNDCDNNSGLRYIPQLILEQPVSENSFFDTEVSFNGYLTANGSNSGRNSELKLYRLKLRFATTQTETRIGLQKINFGPAMLLRSLRWFDRLDLRDPLKLTEGVYGVRFKYNALNNANFWLWGLYGNDDTKGYETLSTSHGKPEFGGRLQYPVPYGELAAAFHTRRVDASILDGADFTENRFALDGRWDMGIGFWFESVLQQQKTNDLPCEWTKIITLGMDYTFGIGNGLYIMGEHMPVVSSDKPLGWKEDRQISAFYFNYPLGYLDTLMAIGHYSWDEEQYYQYLSWQRTYDNLILNFSLFRYPGNKKSAGQPGQTVPVSGYGGQLMIIYNH